jgi:hypothetical protein
MNTVAQKFGITTIARIAVQGLDPDTTRTMLEEIPEGSSVHARDGAEADQLILAASGLESLRTMLPNAWNEVAGGGRLWVWYRKGATKRTGTGPPLHRDSLQLTLGEFGLVGVTLVSVDAVWSSMRVRPIQS